MFTVGAADWVISEISNRLLSSMRVRPSRYFCVAELMMPDRDVFRVSTRFF